MAIKSRVLIFDIETAPILAYVWDTKDQNIANNQIHTDWYVIGWAAKWLGDKPSKVIYHDQRTARDIEDDRIILRSLWNLLSEADIVITQNGKNFDTPKLNARFIQHGWPPPKPYKHLDTYQIARNAAKFTSNKLEYLTDKLCTKYKKLDHAQFPGFKLWRECLRGNIKAWNEMRRYNIHDVLSTEELYMKLRSWAPENAPKVHPTVYLENECATCGMEGRMNHRGWGYRRATRFKRLVCMSCNTWTSGKPEAL